MRETDNDENAPGIHDTASNDDDDAVKLGRT